MLAGSLGAPLTAILSSREVTYCRPALPMVSIEVRGVIVWWTGMFDHSQDNCDHDDFEGPTRESQFSDKHIRKRQCYGMHIVHDVQRAIAIDCSQLASV
jgi:hypothetical protein